MTYHIAEMAGALLPTLIISRFVLFLLRFRLSGPVGVCIGHAITIALCFGLAGFGKGYGGFDSRISSIFGQGSIDNLMIYGGAAMLWLSIDLYRVGRGKRTVFSGLRPIKTDAGRDNT